MAVFQAARLAVAGSCSSRELLSSGKLTDHGSILPAGAGVVGRDSRAAFGEFGPVYFGAGVVKRS